MLDDRNNELCARNRPTTWTIIMHEVCSGLHCHPADLPDEMPEIEARTFLSTVYGNSSGFQRAAAATLVQSQRLLELQSYTGREGEMGADLTLLFARQRCDLRVSLREATVKHGQDELMRRQLCYIDDV